MSSRRFIARLAIIALALLAPALTASAAGLRLTARLVIASREPGPVDRALEEEARQLRRLFNFESYRLAGRSTASVPLPGRGRLPLPEGQSLTVDTEAAGDQVRLRVRWNSGDKERLATSLVLRRGVPAVIGGPPRGDRGEVFVVLLVAEDLEER